MKKFLSLILSCSMCLTVVASTGCWNKDPQDSSTAPVVEKLEVANENLFLTLGDKAELSASYNVLEGETLSWSSSSPSVVSVDENGHIEALKVGSATITAQYGSKQDSCKVEVSLSGNVPTLVFDNNIGEEITLMKGSAFDFSSHVVFNGKAFSDGAIEYQVADESIGTITDGKFTANNVVGSTSVSVYATWRGQTVHAKTVHVNVISETTVLLNGGMLTSICVYTAAEHEGKTYNTTQTISSVFVSENGTEIEDYTLSILDEGVAGIEYSGNSWNITAKKAGKTNLLVSYGGKEFPFALEVKRPVKDLDFVVDYSTSDAMYLDKESKTFKALNELIDGFSGIVSYEYLGKEYKLKNIATLPAGAQNEVTLYNEYVGYRMDFNTYTMFIDELKDFEVIYAGETKTTVEGSYLLTKDIIEPNTVLSMPAGMVPNDFAGTFDGAGHMLSFTFDHGTQHAFGLFGNTLHGATIKNLALVNITKTATTGKNPAGILCSQGAREAGVPEYTLENLYIDVKFSNVGETNLAVMGNVMWAAIINNVIIHVPEVPEGIEYGAFARGNSISIKNTYVISGGPIYVSNPKPNGIENWIWPTLYADYSAMKAAGNDYSSFSAEYWDVTTHGIPVWKTLVEDFVA